MNKAKERCGVAIVAVCVFLVSAAALASVSYAQPKSGSAKSRASTDSSSCSSPLIHASGGLCCPGPRDSTAPCISSTPSMLNAAERKLPPLVVNGVRIPLPVALQLIKRGLYRSWSQKLADRGLLVCIHRKKPGTLERLLYCETNGSYFKERFSFNGKAHKYIKPSDIKVHCFTDCFLVRENIIVALARYVDRDEKRSNKLAALLERAPSAWSTYSLRVPETVPLWFPSKHIIENYPAYVTFFVGNGEIVDVEFARNHKVGITVKSDAKIRKQQQREEEGCRNGMISC